MSESKNFPPITRKDGISHLIGLFLECVENSVNQLFFESRVDISSSEIT